MRFLRLLSLLAVCLLIPAAYGADKNLRVYFIDVEGGQSTLFISPSGQSLLVDTGWPDNNFRDADRIVAVAKQAGLDHLDFVLITHFHDDHVGGVPQLTERIPVTTFLDHGVNRELTPEVGVLYDAYKKVLATGKYKNIQPKPGDKLPIQGFEATVISADGKLIEKPLVAGGQANGYCKASEVRPADQTENARSLGIQINFGKLRLLDLGDLTWDKEMELMCPTDRLGPMDIYIVSHHGWLQSSSPALVDALHARVAIMDNGAKKGGSTPTLKTIKAAPGLETLWQLHYSIEGGDENNTAAEYIANITKEKDADPANYLELIASPSGSFDVYNSRTKATKHYAAK